MRPNFLGIGAEKSGTTWLYHNLKNHPEIYLPETKEIHYFNIKNSNLETRDNFYNKGIGWYESFFRNVTNEEAIGEITPMYICDEIAYKRIYKTLGEVKIIAMLRNPIDRAYSHYWMARRKGHVNSPFDKIVKRKDERFIKRGLYAQQLKRFYNLWDSSNICIFIFNKFFNNKKESLKKIFNFLDISQRKFFKKHMIEGKINKSGGYRSKLLYNIQKRIAKNVREYPIFHPILDYLKKIGFKSIIENINKRKESYPDMDRTLRLELIDFYSSDIEELEELINEDLSKWKIYN